MPERGKYEDRLNLNGTEIIIYDDNGKVMGIYPYWKGLEYAQDNKLRAVRLDEVGRILRWGQNR